MPGSHEEEIHEASKNFGRDKNLHIDDYEVYSSLSPTFAPHPVGVTRFSQNKTNLLRNNNHRGDHTSNFRPLTILHTDFQILSKFFSRTYWLKDLFFLENDMPAQHRLV